MIGNAPILWYKYGALFLIECIASFGVPLPAGAALVAGGIFAGQGYFSITYVVLYALLGNIVGEVLFFLLVRKWREKITGFFHMNVKKGTALFKKFEGAVSNRPFLAVFVSRFIATLCSAVTALTGLSTVPFRAFLLAASLGETVNTVGYAFLGFYFGFEWEFISDLMVPIGLIILICGGVIFLLWRRRKIHE